MEYYKLFNQNIASKVRNKLIYSHGMLKEDKYDCLYHKNHNDAPFQIGKLLREHLLFYVFSESEYIDRSHNGEFEDIEKSIQHIKINRLPNRKGAQNGIYGETLLDLLLMLSQPKILKASIRTIHRQRSDNQEIKGFDSTHVVFDRNKTTLIFGQSKLGTRRYCISKIKEDIEKMKFLYIYEELMFIADKRGNLDPQIVTFLEKLNKLFIEIITLPIKERKERVVNYFVDNNIRIQIPCLLAYETIDLYSNEFEEKYIQEIKLIKETVAPYRVDLPIEHDIIFMIFPLSDRNMLRKGMRIDEEI